MSVTLAITARRSRGPCRCALASRLFRSRLALTTILTVAPFMSYGRQAYAACVGSPSPIFICSDANAVTQTINVDDADVSTVPGFSVNAAGNGIEMTAAGHLRFTDANASSITGTSVGLYMRSLGNSADNDGAITINADSNITGGVNGMLVVNEGDGSIDITVDGQVTGQTSGAMVIRNSGAGIDLTITTGALSVVSGFDHGIDAENSGIGSLSITANGDVGSTLRSAIYAVNSGAGTDLTITTGAGSTATGGAYGIYATQYGSGDLAITANGEVTGGGDDGIFAFNSGGGKLIVTTGAQSVITGADNGIDLDNNGYGGLEVTVNGTVTGLGGNGILATNSSTGANLKGLKVTTGAASIVTGSVNGIHADNFGYLDVEITVNGVVTGEGENGIYSRNAGNEDTIIKVGATGLVQGNEAGIYVRSGFIDAGQDIFITNDGVVRNLSGEPDDRAITARGGPATIDNNGNLIGTVWTGTYGDTLNNAGLWFIAGGINDFGGSYDGDVVNNSGTIIAADNAAVGTLTIIDNVEQFNNSGVVSLVDGGELDTLNLAALPGDIAYVGNGGKLAVDGFLAPGASGRADILHIAGTSAGTTFVTVNLTNPLGSTPNLDGIPVIEVDGTTAEDHFRIEGGVLNAGFFAWNLQLDGDTHELITVGLGAGSFEFAAGITGAQDIWHQTTGTLLQRQADLRALLAGTQVTPVADFSEPVAPTPVAHVTPGLWFKGVGAYLERDQDEANNVLTDRKQEIYGVLGGFDFGTESAGEAWLFGLFGGYLYSTLDFDQTGSEWKYEGPSVGAYATYLNDAFYADVTIKADFLDVDIDADDIAPGEGDAGTDALNLGGQIDAGYKVSLDRGLFVEPQASIAVVHTETDDIDDIFGGAVEFEDETSVRGRLGVRLGHELTASNQVIYSSDVTASVWQEFTGDNDATIFAPLTPATDLSDDPGGTFGDVAIGFSVLSPEGWSSFLRGNYQFSDDYDAFAGNAGVRYAW